MLTGCRPSSLILPYDPAFLPETGLPGITIDFSLLGKNTTNNTSQVPVGWAKSPVDSVNSGSQVENPQIELPSDDEQRELQGLDNDLNVSAQKRGLLGKPQGVLEEGVLLQPDFGFDADGNIVEFDASNLSPRKRRKLNTSLQLSEGPTTDMIAETSASTFIRFGSHSADTRFTGSYSARRGYFHWGERCDGSRHQQGPRCTPGWTPG